MFPKLLIFSIFLITYSACDDIYDNCSGSYHCVEKRLVKFVDRIDEPSNVPILGDFVTLSKTDEQYETPRTEESLLERCARFLANRELRVKLSSDAAKGIIEESRSSKLKKVVLPLLLLLKLKAAIVVTVVLAIIALISFKGLGASLIALAISGATGFKSLLENHAAGSKVSYEVLPSLTSPHWSRVGMDPLTQVYPPAAYP